MSRKQNKTFSNLNRALCYRDIADKLISSNIPKSTCKAVKKWKLTQSSFGIPRGCRMKHKLIWKHWHRESHIRWKKSKAVGDVWRWHRLWPIATEQITIVHDVEQTICLANRKYWSIEKDDEAERGVSGDNENPW